MNHFNGIIPDERWKNDVLNELRTMNELLRELIGRDAQTSKQELHEVPKAKRTYRKRSEVS